MAWTPDRVEALKKMWSDGHSASQIASDLGGVTRNAVIGKIHRLGLSNRGTGIQKDKNENLKQETASKSTNGSINETLNTNKTKKRSTKQKKASINLTQSIKETPKPVPKNVNKPIIFTANQPLPPQPSTSEISEETLKNVKSIEKKSKKLSLMELTERTCKWPIGDPATDKFWFCGHIAEPGKPYCETHIEIAFQPVASRRERRLR